MSPKRAPTARVGRDRFTAESYTVLGKNTKTKAQQINFYICNRLELTPVVHVFETELIWKQK